MVIFEWNTAIRNYRNTKSHQIAMGTQGRRGVAYHFMGSVEKDVVNPVDCPIWTYVVRK